MNPIQINFYTRRNCHLCEEAWKILSRLAAEYCLRVEAIDVDTDPRLARLYGQHIPVATWGERELFRHRAREQNLRDLLASCLRDS